jgi:hypothetical protein
VDGTGPPDRFTLPGDDVLPEADIVMDRRLQLAGSPERVWPWLVQLGKKRAGWYLPRSVERLVPRRRRALRYVEPRLQQLREGDKIPDWGPGSPEFEVLAIEAPRHLLYWSQRPRRARRGRSRPPIRLTWVLVLEGAGGDRSVLHLRLRLALGHAAGPLVRTGGGAVDAVTVWLLGRGLNERLR